jgi:hypothetical protein
MDLRWCLYGLRWYLRCVPTERSPLIHSRPFVDGRALMSSLPSRLCESADTSAAQREDGRGISAGPSLLAGRCFSHAQTPLVLQLEKHFRHFR